MKQFCLLLVVLIFAACPRLAFAQTVHTDTAEHGGAYPLNKNTAANPCITASEYETIEKRIAENQHMLKKNTSAGKSTGTTLFSWPLRMANGLNDCSYYLISNYVDHDPTTGLKDYNCGANTYDGHKGNDIATFPYPFYKVDNKQVEVIAAAPGIIIDKADGYYDRNCAMSGATANSVIVQHADGSCALYWHMKNGSVTTKAVGQPVTTGEYLGVVASSGNSTGPHLHFEVWKGTSSSTLNDAYAGPCNTLNTSSWWVSQKSYTEPAVISVSVNSANAVVPGCPATEVPNEAVCLPESATGYFYINCRNETPGMTANLRIINPNGTTYTSWTHNSTTSYEASYWWWTKTVPGAAGIYTFEAVYNGITCSKTFRVDCTGVGVPTAGDNKDVTIYPNPANTALNILVESAEPGDYTFTLRNVVGQVVVTAHAVAAGNSLAKTLPVAALPDGIYMLEIASAHNHIVSKVLKQQ